ncbi:hypothetical protein [Qipengyuania sp.]|uniref:hypothetical protein n=1 Tax=Qipengyuania sp. TaxID=2004515 RepID=UPI0035C78CDD
MPGKRAHARIVSGSAKRSRRDPNTVQTTAFSNEREKQRGLQFPTAPACFDMLSKLLIFQPLNNQTQKAMADPPV